MSPPFGRSESGRLGGGARGSILNVVEGDGASVGRAAVAAVYGAVVEGTGLEDVEEAKVSTGVAAHSGRTPFFVLRNIFKHMKVYPPIL